LPSERRPAVLIDEILTIKRFLDTLPGIMPNVVPGDEECVEIDLHGTHLIATVDWAQLMGSRYAISTSLSWGGSFTDIVLVREMLIVVFGEPFDTYNRGTVWWYFFPTPDERIPPSLVQMVLGTDRMRALAAELTSGEREILYRVLATFGSFPSDFDVRTQLASHLIAQVQKDRLPVFEQVLTSILTESGQTRAQLSQ
jgi:hypothetical protein